MKKRLNSDALMQEFQEGSVFFRKPSEPAAAPKEPEAARPNTSLTPPESGSLSDTTVSRYHDTATDTTLAADLQKTISAQPSNPLLERTRRAVKHLGKEAATHRFTVEEKKALKRIEHEYALKGIRTSENEITRIAINYVTEEYRQNKEASVLAQVLDLLNN